MARAALASVDRMLTMLGSRGLVSRTITMDTRGASSEYPENIPGDRLGVQATLDPSTKLITMNIQGKIFKGEYPQSTLSNEIHHVCFVWKQTKKVTRKVNWYVYTKETEETVETGITLELNFYTDNHLFVPNVNTFRVTYHATE